MKDLIASLVIFVPMAIVLIVFVVACIKDDVRPQKNVKSAQIEYEGEIYEFRFWTESNVADWAYAGVYKVLPPKIKRSKEIPQYKCIAKTCWATDRVEWCWTTLTQYVSFIKIEQKDLEKVAEFCGDAKV